MDLCWWPPWNSMASLPRMSRSSWFVAMQHFVVKGKVMQAIFIQAAGFYTVESVVYAPKKKLMEIKVKQTVETDNLIDINSNRV